jgi:plasmid stabilization system protein ParE
MSRAVIISASAQSDLRDIVVYVARQDQESAIRLVNTLVDRAESLSNFPSLAELCLSFHVPICGS